MNPTFLTLKKNICFYDSYKIYILAGNANLFMFPEKLYSIIKKDMAKQSLKQKRKEKNKSMYFLINFRKNET